MLELGWAAAGRQLQGREKAGGLLRLEMMLGDSLLRKLWPNSLPIFGEQFLSCHEAACRGFDRCTVGYGNRTGSVRPAADVRRMCANSFRQRRLAPAFLREVGFDVHEATV